MTEAEERWHWPAGESLPATSCQAGETVLSLARAWSRLPCPAVVALKRIGDIQVQPDQITLVDECAQVQSQDMGWFRLSRDSEQAWLGVALNVCHGFIRAVLGNALPLLIRPLGSAERGMMAAVLASALRSLGLGQRMTVASADEHPCWQGQQLVLTGTIRGGAEIEGRAIFAGPLSWFVDGADRGPLIPTDKTVVEGVLELGRTMLPAADLDTAAPGDAIAFDGAEGPVPGASWPVTLMIGRSRASARLEPDSSLSLEGAWNPIDESATTSIASTSVEIVAELGRIGLRLDELTRLSKGGAIVLGPRPCDPLALRVGGLLWGAGELVTLAEQLGVRIVRRYG